MNVSGGSKTSINLFKKKCVKQILLQTYTNKAKKSETSLKLSLKWKDYKGSSGSLPLSGHRSSGLKSIHWKMLGISRKEQKIVFPKILTHNYSFKKSRSFCLALKLFSTFCLILGHWLWTAASITVHMQVTWCQEQLCLAAGADTYALVLLPYHMCLPKTVVRDGHKDLTVTAY